MFIKKSESGFNLVELMVVVSIIGILSSVAVPRFNTFRARAQQTEAKGGLSGVFLAAQAYMANANAFVDNSGPAKDAGIGFVLDGARPQYWYILVSKPVGWAAAAYSIKAGGAAGDSQALANSAVDLWRINANKWLCSPYDAVSATAATEKTTLTGASTAKDCPQSSGALAAAAIFPLAKVAATDDINL